MELSRINYIYLITIYLNYNFNNLFCINFFIILKYIFLLVIYLRLISIYYFFFWRKKKRDTLFLVGKVVNNRIINLAFIIDIMPIPEKRKEKKN